MLSKRIYSKKRINKPSDCIKYLCSMIKDKDKEHSLIITMNAHNIPIKVHIISIGTLNSSLVHPREVFSCAIADKAAFIIFAHNHPSGILEPSEADLMLKSRLSDCGQLMGIDVIDNLIIDNKNNFTIL